MNRIPLIALLVATVVAAAVGGYLLARREAAAPAAPAAERAVLYWYDPMQPQQHFAQPGKSPFMDMALVPKYADEAVEDGGVRIDPRLADSLGVRTAIAERGVLNPELAASATLAWDERAVSVVAARADGIVATLEVRAPLQPVKRGAVLARLILPAWTAAASEYLSLARAPAPGLERLRAAARQRLQLLGMDDARIAAIERSGVAPTRFDLVAPRDGVVTELMVREGASVTAGMPIAELRGTTPLWVLVAIPESAVAQIAPGSAIALEPAAFPGDSVPARWLAWLPAIDPATRSRTLRLEIDNPDGRLAAGMFARVRIAAAGGPERVLVPSEALIVTGRRSVVIVDRGDGHFEPRTVRVGAESGDRSEILEGLDAGERVVRSGQFLIDSEASLRATLGRLSGDDGAATPTEPAR